MVMEILTRRVASINTDGMQLITPPHIGQDWVKRFIQRHPNLGTIVSARMDVTVRVTRAPYIGTMWVVLACRLAL